MLPLDLYRVPAHDPSAHRIAGLSVDGFDRGHGEANHKSPLLSFVSLSREGQPSQLLVLFPLFGQHSRSFSDRERRCVSLHVPSTHGNSLDMCWSKSSLYNAPVASHGRTRHDHRVFGHTELLLGRLAPDNGSPDEVIFLIIFCFASFVSITLFK